MSLSQKYKESKEQTWSMRFKTHHPDGNRFDGVVTHIQKNFIVLKEQTDFVFNGVVVLAKKVIKGYRDGKYETCANDILRHTGAIKHAKSPRWLDTCTTLKEVLETLQKKDIWPYIEIVYELDGKTETDVFVGKVTRVEKDAFWIYDYDAAGNWLREWEIRYDEIFKIQFDDLYTKHFNAYMRTQTENSPADSQPEAVSK